MSCRQESTKGGHKQFVSNGGGGGVVRVLQSLRGDQVNFIVMQPKSSKLTPTPVANNYWFLS